AVEASRLRFRPILMTSFAFILGVLPPVWATGAGPASRQSLGTAVFGGMLSATVLAVFVPTVSCVAIEAVGGRRSGRPKPGRGDTEAAVPTAAEQGDGAANGEPASRPAPRGVS